MKHVRDALNTHSDYSKFIKPVKTKAFTGTIFNKWTLSELASIPDKELIMVYDILPNIIAEWRVYIHHNQIIDIKNYSGSFRAIPNWDFIDERVKENKKIFPCAYVMDVGIYGSLIKHSTVIEYNDMWAVGNYGIPNELYLRMLKDRYFEIVRSL
jgi:hypothetical protein